MHSTVATGLAYLLTGLVLLGYAISGSVKCLKLCEQDNYTIGGVDKALLTVCAVVAHFGFMFCEVSGNHLCHTRPLSVLELIFVNVGIALLYLPFFVGIWKLAKDTLTGHSLARCIATYVGGFIILALSMS